MVNLSLYTVRAMVILDGDGNRLVAKYYSRGPHMQSYKTVKEQKKFESELFSKTRKSSGEVILYDGHTVLFKYVNDAHFYLVGDPEENELLLSAVLNGLVEAISLLLKHSVDKRNLLDNLDMVVLALDEAVDDGIALETDPNVIASNVSKRGNDTMDVSLSGLNEQVLIDVYKQAKERFNLSMLK
ncbi:Golgi-to-ER vesicle coat component [Coemansia sp. RSA 2671]|uniref:Coatomer subunit zeta n=2 Tax=Coemansia TaxID=4863 RepID=A0A9W8GJU9_9FUNG|nr:Golgi-to-ER vesicle coat component [Coemansia sp. RSA 2675]KAJ2022691.1 Golgi-to-ER vesicle coat component [Coemansia sp. S610]KAJ2339260.1 Golgi-to-ER vesicle coat component [Coemansia sp. RSA 2671]KAJ2364886.1 Golgi-to-ER vesicle coat component [Coemansia sp. RSA 2611]KAJ2413913.1 Golgi-to-ER vesicle coat component [Coemansia sp. RSA 2530]KAJ2685577.1 Golgi-to-ER vesicle coat component [Coemansia spiralis]KAJ2700866.1 Golgi-to-ER vesicle coat component [Coemansia sp. IMI 209128]KAJ27914